MLQKVWIVTFCSQNDDEAFEIAIHGFLHPHRTLAPDRFVVLVEFNCLDMQGLVSCGGVMLQCFVRLR